LAYDEFNDAYGRLRSLHANSRRDGALTLGRLRDPRAVPALVERLEKDGDKRVRMAAAWALAEIGDPRAAVPLEKAALYDKKQDVRDIAAKAYKQLPKEDASTLPPGAGEPTSVEIQASANGTAPRRTRTPAERETPPPPPAPEPGFPDRPNP
jgi:HEAT repeat protein